MITDNTFAENYYLRKPILFNGEDYLIYTIIDLILKKQILLNDSFNVSLNCDYEKFSIHEKLILQNLIKSDLSLNKLIDNSKSVISTGNYKDYIKLSLEKKGLIVLRSLPTFKGFNELLIQRKELKLYSNIIKNKNKNEIVDIVTKIGCSIYNIDWKAKDILKDVYPRCINIRKRILNYSVGPTSYYME